MQISVWHEMFLPILLHLINVTFLPNNLLWQRRCDCDLDGMKEPFSFDLLQFIDCRYLKGNLLWFLIFLSYKVHHFFPLCYRDKFGSIKICPPMFFLKRIWILIITTEKYLLLIINSEIWWSNQYKTAF